MIATTHSINNNVLGARRFIILDEDELRVEWAIRGRQRQAMAGVCRRRTGIQGGLPAVQVTRRRGWRLDSDLVVFASHCRAHVVMYFYVEPLTNHLDRGACVYCLQAVDALQSVCSQDCQETQTVRILGGVLLLSAEAAEKLWQR